MNRLGILYALASAALFGVSTPAAKILLGAIDPIVLAGLLYCALKRPTVPVIDNIPAFTGMFGA